MEYPYLHKYWVLVRHQNDFFFLGDVNEGKSELITHVKEKAIKYNCIQLRHDKFTQWVDNKEVKLFKKLDQGPIDLYFVKYKDYFFRVGEETESQILLETEFNGIAYDYGFAEPRRMDGFLKWVNRDETTPIDQIDVKVAYYREIIFDILDQRSDEYLISSPMPGFLTPWFVHRHTNKPDEDGWELVGNLHQKWMPREKLYVYGVEEIPARI
jgi:hypothetical protein